jgi:hypothetical protein
MAIADYSTYVAESAGPYQQLPYTKTSFTAVAGAHFSLWTATPFAGATPTTAAVPTRSTTGALPSFQNSSGTQRLIGGELGLGNSGMLILCDRLSHQGGLSGIVTTAQTTNLPTSALTRYTSGEGVMAAVEIYGQIGTTATTFTASYTNSGSTSGRTTLATAIGGTGNREVGRFIIFPLQQGDTGVEAVASVTVLATTGTAGNFGVTLFKPLACWPIPIQRQQWSYDGLLNSGGNVPEIPNDSCLFFLIVSSTSSSGAIQCTLNFAED